jgi:hypothetical protein
MWPEMSGDGRFVTTAATASLNHSIFSNGLASTHWLAGLIAADGTVSRDQRRWSVAQSGDDGRELIEYVRYLIQHTGAVSVTHPAGGRPSHAISAGSAQMVSDLMCRYRITPVKTLTYEWPDLTGSAAQAFLRGYVDGDGCVAVYRTPQMNPMLHLSLVGTPAFIEGAAPVIPARGRIRRIERCANLSELRFTGRHAWGACQWLYADVALYGGRKYSAFGNYAAVLAADPPRWHLNQGRRQHVLRCLNDGMTIRATAAATGTHISVVCKWKASEA